MSHTLNGIADGFETLLSGLTGVRAYSEMDEKATPGDVAAEVTFRNLVMVNPAAAAYDVDAVIVLSTDANKPGWSAALRRIRDYCAPYGSLSVHAAILANPTLSGAATSVRPHDSGFAGESRKRYADGDRWEAELIYRVRFAR